MSRKIAGLLLLILSLMASVPASTARGEPASVVSLPPVSNSSPQFGIVDAFQSRDLARRSGARWQRIAFFWNSIQPDSPDQWSPNHYSTDADIAGAVADGVQPVGLIGNPPAWATRNGSVPKNLDLPIDDPANYWARFVGKLVKQNAGQIDDWIIWNEPDITPESPGSTWAGSADEYYQLLKTAWQAARAANPKARIVFAGTTYWFDLNRGNKQFLERVIEAGAADPTAVSHGYYFDAVDVHLYSSPSHIYTVPLALRKILQKNGLDKPIWASELNVVPTNDPAAIVPRGGFRSSLEEQADYVIQVMALARVANVERISIYKMIDGQIINGEPYGLVRNDLSIRPAYVAYQVGAKYLTGSGTTNYEQNDGYDLVTIDSGSQRVTALWATGPSPVTATVPLAGARARQVGADGNEIPITAAQGQVSYVVPLAGATANTDDKDPSHYLIGGAPIILVEEGVGDEVTLSPTEVYFPRTGFTSADRFLDYFQHRGGLRTFGYPISRPFRLNGQSVQFYQRQVMELRASGEVGLLNLLDEDVMPYTRINGAVFPAIDRTLTKQAPTPSEPGYATKIITFIRQNSPDKWTSLPVGFGRTFSQTVKAEDAFGGKKVDPGVVAGLNLELWGVPTSRPERDPANDNFIYLRYQRGIMHYDRTTGITQGLLLADYLKQIVTGQGLPPDLETQAQESRLYRQYDRTKPGWIARPGELPDTDLTKAFDRGR